MNYEFTGLTIERSQGQEDILTGSQNWYLWKIEELAEDE